MAQTAKNGEQLKGWDKVVAWYASQAYAVGIVYSLGAAVVIIGALFKILHWPGASVVLMIGMFTEALLFTIGIFEKPHAAYHWENVYPQLLGDEVKEVLGGNGAAAPAGSNVAAVADAAALDPKDVKALQQGIANVADAANQLAELGKLAEGSKALSDRLAAAAVATDKFTGAQDNLVAGVAGAADSANKVAAAAQQLGANFTAAANSIAPVAASGEAAAKATAAVAQNIASLNAAYELQLKAAQNAQKDADAYAAAQAKLAAQVADLNKVYGNMLSAL